MKPRRQWQRWTATMALLGVSAAAWALEPPRRGELERYRRDGSFQRRLESALALGNHRSGHPSGLAGAPTPDRAAAKNLPAAGQPRTFALLVSFADWPEEVPAETIDERLFGDGDEGLFPYDSLRAFYRRSSYGQLDLDGSTLAWYRTPYPRDQVEETWAGREALIAEAIAAADAAGHDFTRYDNDGDGVIDYFMVFWTGPIDGWADFWWGYQTRFVDDSFTVDGKHLGVYSWQWERNRGATGFSITTVIHETGHALGLPDYYDYDDSIGPDGGVGGLDQMDSSRFDHGCFSKLLLGWIQPQVVNQGSEVITLGPADAAPEAVLVMTGEPQEGPFGEYFMLQFRRPEGNDRELPGEGLVVWHVDARLDPWGGLSFDNSYTDHKLLRLVQADGLESIENGGRADADDFFRPGDAFGPTTLPSSDRYDGDPSNVRVDGITRADDLLGLHADLGDGCAIRCIAAPPTTAWPMLAADFTATIAAANCVGEPAATWDLGDGSRLLAAVDRHAYAVPGAYEWSFDAVLGEATCRRGGTVLVCRDLRCWRWYETPDAVRTLYRPAISPLADGRVLVAGGRPQTLIYAPRTRTWTPAGETQGIPMTATATALPDGRVLMVGGSTFNAYNSEVFDPASESWSLPQQLANSPAYHRAAILADGRVLIAGGVVIAGDPDLLYTLNPETFLFDPASETWSRAGDLPRGFSEPGLTALADGRVLLTAERSALFFDPATEIWEESPGLPFVRRGHFALRLDDGRVLIGGGSSTDLTTLYDPAADRWAPAGRLSTLRIGSTATRLGNGRVVVVGGFDVNGQSLASVELFDPATSSWTEIGSLASGRGSHAATALGDGTVLVMGGATTGEGTFDFLANGEHLLRPATEPRQPGGRRVP